MILSFTGGWNESDRLIKIIHMRQTVDTVTRIVLILLISLLVIDVVWQVFSRYILQSPSTFTDELARFLLIWLSLLGGAYYSGKNMHIAIRILPDRLGSKKRYWLDLISAGIIILFVFAVFVVGGGILVYLTYTFKQITPALQILMA